MPPTFIDAGVDVGIRYSAADDGVPGLTVKERPFDWLDGGDLNVCTGVQDGVEQ